MFMPAPNPKPSTILDPDSCRRLLYRKFFTLTLVAVLALRVLTPRVGMAVGDLCIR